jgi:hypothetical protein
MGFIGSKFFYFLVLVFVSWIIFKSLEMLNVEYVYFLSYLLWFIALGLFALVLPSKHESVF